jgi:hypothetical protein
MAYLMAFGLGQTPWSLGVILPYKLDATEYLSDPAHIEFAKRQCDDEAVAKGCFSQTFDKLLPGMLSVPVSVAMKIIHPNSGSASMIALSLSPSIALIDKKRATVPLDDLQSFGRRLLDFRKKVGPHQSINASRGMPKQRQSTVVLKLDFQDAMFCDFFFVSNKNPNSDLCTRLKAFSKSFPSPSCAVGSTVNAVSVPSERMFNILSTCIRLPSNP